MYKTWLHYLWWHGTLYSCIPIIIVIPLLLLGPCSLAGSFSAVVDALNRTRQEAMRDEPLDTVKSCIYQLRLACFHRDAQHIQKLCKAPDTAARLFLFFSFYVWKELATG